MNAALLCLANALIIAVAKVNGDPSTNHIGTVEI